MIYPDSFESKLGFAVYRGELKQLCDTLPGRLRVEQMQFVSSPDALTAILAPLGEMLVLSQNDDPLPLGILSEDTSQVLALLRPEGAAMSLAGLVMVSKLLNTVNDVRSYFRSRNSEESAPYPALTLLTVELDDFASERREIDRVLDSKGEIRDTASPALAELRVQIRSMAGRVNTVLQRVLARAVSDGLVDRDTVPGIRDGRPVLPLPAGDKRRIPGIIHDESATGKTVYIEPAEVVEFNNRLRSLQLEEQREISRILAAVAMMLRPRVDDIAYCYDVLGQLDFIRAKARLADRMEAIIPTLETDPRERQMEWYGARHPLLEASLREKGHTIVPLDIQLTPRQRIIVVSGPNAGGKSVCLKTVGLLQYMLQCGLAVPVYENSRFCLFDDIFVDIGDDQSIMDDLSTYSSHLRAMKEFLRRGRPSSLFLIDELGSGTEPQIGGAIAQAVLTEFVNRGMWGVVTTHYSNLKVMASETPGMLNASMLYDRQRMQPLYKLMPGNPGSSFALEIARKTGMPATVIDMASKLVGDEYISTERYLLDIARDKRYWATKRAEVQRREKELQQTIDRYRDDADELRRQRRVIIEEARQQGAEIIAKSNAAVERAIGEIRAADAERRATLEARQRLVRERQAIENASPRGNSLLKKAPKTRKKRSDATTKPEQRPLQPGDNVKLDGSGIPGRIEEISGQNATVVFGQVKTRVPLSRLKLTDAKPGSNSSQKSSYISPQTLESRRTRQLNFKTELDLRGMRVDEALTAVSHFLDDAISFSTPRVRLLHGTGTGALRQAIRQMLGTIAGVESYHDEDVRLGGAGITVVNLE